MCFGRRCDTTAATCEAEKEMSVPCRLGALRLGQPMEGNTGGAGNGLTARLLDSRSARQWQAAKASISRFSRDLGWLKNGIQAEVSTMTTPPPLLLLVLLELQLLQILPSVGEPSVGELDLSGESLQPLELLPP